MKPAHLLIAILILLTACNINFGKKVEGNGRLSTVTRNIAGANEIHVSGSIVVELSQGEPGISISADENLMEYIITEVKGDELEIHYKSGVSVSSKNEVKIKVSMQQLNEAAVDGSGSIISASKFVSDGNITVGVSGSGTIKLNANAPKISAAISGSGNIETTGETKDVKVDISGSGRFNSYSTMAENADINISGSGKAYVFADVKLNANISGSGTVYYKGKAENIVKSVSGSGDVIKE